MAGPNFVDEDLAPVVPEGVEVVFGEVREREREGGGIWEVFRGQALQAPLEDGAPSDDDDLDPRMRVETKALLRLNGEPHELHGPPRRTARLEKGLEFTRRTLFREETGDIGL